MKRQRKRPDVALPEEASNRRKKNTSKWCKGKAGILHSWEWVLAKSGVFASIQHLEYTYQTQQCSNCGKHGDYRAFHMKCMTPHGNPNTYYWRWDSAPTKCPLE